MYRKRRSNKGTIITILIIVITIIGFFTYDKIGIDTKKPVISTKNDVLYIGNHKLKFKISDNKGIEFYSIVLTDGKNTLDIKSSNVNNKRDIYLNIEPPKIDLFFDKKSAVFIVTAIDNSIWNFGFGNKTTKEIKIVFDNEEPNISIINASKSISKGGSALIIFEVADKYIDKDSIYIQTNFEKKYKPVVFIKEGFYASLIAWPVYESSFFASVVASDKAGNKAKKLIPIYKRNRGYKTSTIKLKDKFLNGKITSLYTELATNKKQAINDIMNNAIKPKDRFKHLNENQRQKDENIIASHTTQATLTSNVLENFSISSFYPLKNAARVGSFGAFRIFKKKSKKISSSYHLGLDLASVRRADIVTNNKARVVFVGDLGLYGNSVILDHTLGLYTLYSHISRVLVYDNDNIPAGKVIGRTGTTGLALGDHLHFGVLVQGVEVRPQEWMDKVWIRNNINSVLAEAKKYIKNSN